jgi:hypothetical protein
VGCILAPLRGWICFGIRGAGVKLRAFKFGCGLELSSEALLQDDAFRLRRKFSAAQAALEDFF